MDAYGGIEQGLGCAGSQGDGDSLHDLARVGSHHMHPDYPITGLVDDQLHKGLLVPAADCVLHRFEGRLEQANVAKPGAGLLLSETHCADIGLAEHRAGNEIVIDDIFQLAELAAGEGHTFGQRYRCEFHAAGDIAQGENTGFCCAVFRVYDDGTEFIDLNVHVFQAQSFEVRLAASGVQYGVGFDGSAVGQLQLEPAGAPGDGFDIDLKAQVHPGLGNLAGGMGTDIRIEAPQEQWAAVQLGNAGAEAIENTGELHGDVATADDDQPLRELLQVEDLIGTQCQIAAGERRDMGPATGGYQDFSSAEATLANRHRVSVDDTAAPVDHVGLHTLQQPIVDAIQAGNFLLLVIAQGGPVESRFFAVPAVVTRVAEGFGEL